MPERIDPGNPTWPSSARNWASSPRGSTRACCAYDLAAIAKRAALMFDTRGKVADTSVARL